MPYTQVQFKNASVGDVSGTTIAVTMDSAYGAANLAQAWTHSGNIVQFPTMADDRGGVNTYNEVTACRIDDTTNSNRTAGFYAKDLKGSGAATVTATWGSSTNWRTITVTEFSGLDTANPLVAGNANEQVGLGAGTDNIVSGNINFTANPAVLCGYSRCDGPGPGTPGRGTGFSDGGSDGTFFYRWEHKRVTTAGNAQATFNSPGSSDYNTMAMGLNEFIPPFRQPRKAHPSIINLLHEPSGYLARARSSRGWF